MLRITSKQRLNKIYALFVIALLFSVYNNYALAQENHFDSAHSGHGLLSVDLTTGNIAISDSLGISIYSPITFEVLYSNEILNGSSYNKFTNDGLFLITCLGIHNYPVIEGQLKFIRTSDYYIQTVDIDRYINNFDISNTGNEIYVAGGLHDNLESKVYKINLNTLSIENEITCGKENLWVVLNHDNTKLYVYDDERHAFGIATDHGEGVDLSTLHSYVWIFNPVDLSPIGKMNIDCYANKLIRGETGQIIVAHDPPDNPNDASITIVNTIDDSVDREINFPETGFHAIDYNPVSNIAYGVISKIVWTSEKSYNHVYINSIGQIDLSNDNLILIPVGSEILGPAIALSPDSSRVYVPSYESDKIYYIDL